MTWLSRLLPQRNRLQLVGTPTNRTPVSKRNRRQMTLEALEHRVVLSVTAVPNFSGVLNITVDKFANNFTIEEFKINSTQSKVTLTANDAKTLINGGSTWTSFGAVSSINVKIASNTQANKDTIELVGEGIGTQEGVKNVTFTAAAGSSKGLVLNVHDINNSGAFKVTTHGLLDLDMDSAKWNSISITQDGCCPADVSIINSISAGSVTIKEGWGDGSSINLDNDQFGVTKLYQAYGAKSGKYKNCDGNDDSVTVTNSRLNSLCIDQNAKSDGNNNTVYVDTVSIALLPKYQKTGICVIQGNGDDDSAIVTNVSTYGNPNLPSCVGISITQGSGHNDYAEVSHATVPGDVTIVQQDVLGGPDDHGIFGDTALISDVHAGRPNEYYCGEICITQGDAKGDSATIQDSSTEELDVCIVQGDGELDDALVSNVTSGCNIYVTQGDAIPTGDPDKDPHGGDTATVDGSTAECDIKVGQGDGNGNSATVSNSTAGYDPSGENGNSGCITICQGDGDDNTALVDTSTAANGDIKIDQGDGDRDHATIQCSTAGHDVCVTQGDGDLDVVDILGVIAGSVDYSDGYPKDVYGNVTVVQGDGQHDIVNVDECNGIFTQVNNLCIIQGDSLPSDDCDIDAYYSDEVHINDSIITSDICVYQGFSWVEPDDGQDGEGYWAETGFGYYLITIGDTSPVTAGGATKLEQAGEGNTVILGGATGEGSGLFDFVTAWLDVWTGSGGGAFVSATNTQVLYGSFCGNDWTIDGGGDGNVFYDGGGNDGVTYSDNFNVTPEF